MNGFLGGISFHGLTEITKKEATVVKPWSFTMKYTIKTSTSKAGISKVNFKKDLNPEQYKVVTESEGPSLVLAGAGSGKTRTLVYRVAYLLNKGIPPQNILLVTFTNKAARTMQDRVEMLLKAKPKNLWSGTFHHIGNKSLRLYAKHLGYRNDFGILDEGDSLDLLKVCIRNMNIKVQEERFPKPKVIKSVISYSVNSGKSIEKTISEFHPYFLQYSELILWIKDEYEKKKKMSNVMDYDDLLTKWLWLLENNNEARNRFQEQFRYILVDEYQDTNRLQAKIIKNLADLHKNVLVVGDDSQAIYSFRAADVTNILNFPNHYGDVKIFKLETNYRSTPEIINLANNSILNNANRFDKKLKPMKESSEKPALLDVSDPYNQAAFVAQRVLELREEGVALKDMAVLFRAHYQSAEVEMELIKRNIPYIVRGGVRFFEQAHIKDVLSYLRILINPLDELAWFRVLTLCPGIGPGYAGKIFDEFTKTGKIEKVLDKKFTRFLPEKAKKGFMGFQKVIKEIAGKDLKKKPDEILKSIIDGGYKNYVYTRFDNANDRIDDLHELINFAHTYKTARTLMHDITMRESFKGESIYGDRVNDEYLVLSTIHQAKGLEWNSVFIIGLCEGQFPHSKTIEYPEQIEEERRLFYVASTRAKDRLYLIHPLTRYDYQMGTVISRKSVFITELSPSLYSHWEIEEQETSDREIELD